jgi:hypothetical protein
MNGMNRMNRMAEERRVLLIPFLPSDSAGQTLSRSPLRGLKTHAHLLWSAPASEALGQFVRPVSQHCGGNSRSRGEDTGQDLLITRHHLGELRVFDGRAHGERAGASVPTNAEEPLHIQFLSRLVEDECLARLAVAHQQWRTGPREGDE